MEGRDAKESPTVLYWAGVLDLQLCCLQLVRADREANFSLYDIKQILPWLFVLDQTNYATWLSVHNTKTSVSFQASIQICTHHSAMARLYFTGQRRGSLP